MVDLKPIAPPPEHRTGAPPPPRYAEVMAMVKRLELLLVVLEPGVYRLADVVAAVDDDATAKLSGTGADPDVVVQAARFLGAERPAGAPDTLLVNHPSVIERRQFNVKTAARRHAELGHEGSIAPAVTVRVLQRRLRGDWVTSWALRGYLHRLVAAGHLVPTTYPPMVWTMPARGHHADQVMVDDPATHPSTPQPDA